MATPDGDRDPATTVLTTPTPPVEPVNAYAVISLVAALLGLFPVAIVFGVLAFTRPAGRGIAIAGLVLGIVELATLLLVFFGIADAVDDATSDGPQTVTSSVYETFVPTAETSTSPTTPPDAEATSPTTTQAPPETTTGPVLNDTCDEGQASIIATDADTGRDIVCTFMGSGGGYRWVQIAALSPGTHERGDACDPATDRAGRSTGGTALQCLSDASGGGSWEAGP